MYSLRIRIRWNEFIRVGMRLGWWIDGLMDDKLIDWLIDEYDLFWLFIID